MEYISLGSTPCGEECAQVGSDNYHERMRKETKAYIRQLKRMFGEPPAGASIRTKGFPHDFGTYHEVCCIYTDEEGAEYAYKLDSALPEFWDEEAKQELGA